jgi:hypothetical protein
MSGMIEGNWFAYRPGLRGPVPVHYPNGIPESDSKNILVQWDLAAVSGDTFPAKPSLAYLQTLFPFPAIQMEKSG